MVNSKMIGNRIAEARKRTGASQAQLAGQLFISPQAVGKWERGESIPDILTVIRLAEILGVDLNYFSGDVDSESGEVPSPGPTVLQSTGLPAGHQKDKMSWDMSRGNWIDADFSGLKNLNEKFSSSNMLRCRFNGSDLSRLLLKSNNVGNCDFTDSDLGGSRIKMSNISGNIFRNCSLKEAELLESNISGCDFSRADFTGTVLKYGGIEKSGMTDTTLDHTSFIAMHLVDMVFTGTIENCFFEKCAFTRVSFENATLLNTFFKDNRKLRRIIFTNCKADRMTYEFLKQGKADLTGITLLAPEGETI
jgi:uncharacterized protein YjbI with pentapeptide repeats/DNA-binding XRE family transcriptional regulator